MADPHAETRTLHTPVGVRELSYYFWSGYDYGAVESWPSLNPHLRRSQLLSAIYDLLQPESNPPSLDAIDRAESALKSVQSAQYLHHSRIHEGLAALEDSTGDAVCNEDCQAAMLVHDLAEGTSDSDASNEAARRLEILVGDLQFIEDSLLLEVQDRQGREREMEFEHLEFKREQALLQQEMEENRLELEAAEKDWAYEQKEVDEVYRTFISEFNEILRESEDWE